jgi:2-hydroxycyclohexanecarboxyl-CoA dehydrogenase
MTMDHKTHSFSFQDCSALIVGGTSGIGKATALQLARSGVPRIAVVGRSPDRGMKARDAIREAGPAAQVHFIQGDAQQLEQARRIVAEAQERLDGIDILVTCTSDPGRYTPMPLQDVREEDIVPTLLSVASTSMIMSRLAVPAMYERGRGVIINVASDAAKVPTPGEAILGAGMAAIALFSRTLAMEAKRFGVRVNALTPSLVSGTPTTQGVQADGFSAKLFRQIEKMANSGLGVCTPEDLAAMAVFLASPEAARITGQVISVNGGISAG